jgi:hypothetical protein
MAGLDPAIHLLVKKASCEETMDTRVKPAHDIEGVARCAASLWVVNDA